MSELLANEFFSVNVDTDPAPHHDKTIMSEFLANEFFSVNVDTDPAPHQELACQQVCGISLVSLVEPYLILPYYAIVKGDTKTSE
ncbi:hypothetical protein E2C01_059181 [Portunus trituberculatus]|uniref:Uncharacterized protein n=1 Tax=Portunus trituberculatus TaxID=210409 RepID=A0A5B7H6V8_PORTR|nr:hypothetical protein [Portunus trituberculatus]